MNAFQQKCSAAVDEVLAACGVGFAYETIPFRPGEVYLRKCFAHEDRVYELYIYANEAGVKIDHGWHVYEDHQYPDPELLTEAFCGFLRQRLRGESK